MFGMGNNCGYNGYVLVRSLVTKYADKYCECKPACGTKPVVLETAVLFRNAREIRLLHQGEEYRLRLTKANKLILTK